MVTRSALFLLLCFCPLFFLCPTAHAQDSCTPVTYRNLLSGNGVSLAANDMISAAGKGIVIAGQAGPAGGEADAWLAAFDENADTRWSFRYHPDSASFSKVVLTSDGYYMAIGLVGSKTYNYNNIGFLQVKLDTAGNILWSKKHFLLSNPGGVTGPSTAGNPISAAIATDDGGIAFCSINGSVVKTDKDGNLRWAKSVAPLLPYNAPVALLQNGDTLLVADNGSAFGLTATFLLKLSATDGRLLGATQLGTGNILRLVTVSSMEKKGGQYRINSFSPSITTSRSDATIFCYDNSGLLRSIRKYYMPSILLTNSAGIMLTAGGEWGGSTPGAAAGPFYAVRLPASTGAVKGAIFNENAHMFSMRATADKGFVSAGNSGSPMRSVLLVKADSSGKTPGCNNIEAEFRIEDVPILVMPAVFPQPADQTYQTGTLATAIAGSAISKTPLCATNHCSTLHITGFDSVCRLQQPVPYGIQKNAGCFSPVRWRVDTSIAGLQDITDSAVSLVFKKQGAVVLYADMITGCSVVSDSLLISVNVSPPSLSLGPDIQICKDGGVPLDAEAGFKWYRWQDGSAGAVFIAPGPGLYWVLAEDYCGYQWTDTVTITRGADVAFEMGPERQRCDNDTLLIEAPGGFSRYDWQPDYNMTSSIQLAQVWPAKDTGYTVIAWTAGGCRVSDTVQVRVMASPAFGPAVGNGICAGQFVVLQAPGGYASYQWQNGARGPSYTATKPDTYWVRVTDANGCSRTDTMVVKRPKDCKQRIYFPNGFTPDNNGRNDAWKPVVLGDISAFHLIIYNRFGEKIFETMNPLQGWEGRFHGLQQPAGVFAWVCSYRFDGEIPQTERGVLLLLR